MQNRNCKLPTESMTEAPKLMFVLVRLMPDVLYFIVLVVRNIELNRPQCHCHRVIPKNKSVNAKLC